MVLYDPKAANIKQTRKNEVLSGVQNNYFSIIRKILR